MEHVESEDVEAEQRNREEGWRAGTYSRVRNNFGRRSVRRMRGGRAGSDVARRYLSTGRY